MNSPVVSFLMCSRVRTDVTNPATRDILKFFRDAVDKIHTEDRKDVEFLIKFDNDDEYAKKIVGDLKHYPFNIRPFFTARGEGLKSANTYYEYLFSRINKHSKFIGFCGDDAVFNHFSQGVMGQLRDNIDDNYIFFTNQRQMTEPATLQTVSDYQNNSRILASVMSQKRLIEPYPIVSRKLIEICGGMGYHYNIDTWLAIINLALFHKHRVLITKNFSNQTFLRDNLQPQDCYERDPFINQDGSYTNLHNADLEDKPYYYQLLTQQATNIYLNIKEDGLLEKYTIDK